MPPDPEFSVVIPAFNAAAWVAGAVESALSQRSVRIEVIVVDDGSTDGTAEVLASFKKEVQVLRQANQGVATSRNRGAEAARGRYLAFLDADDVWAPDKLARQSEAMLRVPDARASSTAFSVVDEDGHEVERRGGQPTESILEKLLVWGNVLGTPSTVVCDRTLFLALRGFDPSLSQCADWEMWLRLALRTRFAIVPDVLVSYRQHAGSMSRNIPLLERDSLQTLDKAFAQPDLPPALRARRAEAYGRVYLVLAGSYFHAGRYTDFIRCGRRALGLNGKQISYLFAYPGRVLRRARRRKRLGA